MYCLFQADAKYQLDAIIKGMDEGHILDHLQVHCDRDFSAVGELLIEMETLLGTVHHTISILLELLSCDRLTPLYEESIHIGICTYGVSSLYWLLVASAGMSLAGSAMLTFRAAYKPQ